MKAEFYTAVEEAARFSVSSPIWLGQDGLQSSKTSSNIPMDRQLPDGD